MPKFLDKEKYVIHYKNLQLYFRLGLKNTSRKIDVKLVNNEKDYLICTSEPSYKSHKIVENNLIAI